MSSTGQVIKMSGMEFAPPKYARVVLELRRRIESGEYPPGSQLPSEAQLVREFAIGRTTVVRALQMLQQDGWITREHGRGSFVKGRPDIRTRAHARPALMLLDRAETSGSVHLVRAGEADAPASVAALLGAEQGARLLMRQWVNVRDDIASELVTCWFPPVLAYGTDLVESKPLTVGVRDHLRTIKGLRIDHITERLTARRPTDQEAKLLQIDAAEPVIAILATAHDATDAARFAVEVLMPGTLHELQDVYSVPN